MFLGTFYNFDPLSLDQITVFHFYAKIRLSGSLVLVTIQSRQTVTGSELCRQPMKVPGVRQVQIAN
jgi:hypothetical protein